VSDVQERAYWLALRRAGLGSSSFALLIARFGSIAEAWRRPSEEIRKAGLEARYVTAFERARQRCDPEEELALLERYRIRAFTWLDEGYPEPLRSIPQSPPVLFVRGALDPTFDQAVAVVGTRRVTPYGRRVTEEFCRVLARLGVAIVSGLARGVDAIAHQTAIAEGGKTAAVLANGLDRVFPRENERLASQILEVGCLVSEYPPGVPARPDYFPRRNRILSGLARATLVVEAGRTSGALHTANWAFEQGRDVFAVPGSIFSPQSEGTNQLIREATAKLVATPEQLCEELNLLAASGQLPLLERRSAEPPPARDPAQEAILRCLQSEPQHVDDVVRATGLPAAAVSSTLQILELEGAVRQVAPLTYAPA